MHQVGDTATERLWLERWRHEVHADGLARVNANVEVQRFVGGTPMTRDESDLLSEQIEAHWDTYGHGLWAVVVRESGEMVGFTGLSHPLWWPAMVERVEVGWRLARDAWGHGYATEAAQEAVRVGCSTLGLDEIVSFVHPENERSLAVTRRLGMTVEADVPHPARDELVRIMRLMCSTS